MIKLIVAASGLSESDQGYLTEKLSEFIQGEVLVYDSELRESLTAGFEMIETLDRILIVGEDSFRGVFGDDAQTVRWYRENPWTIMRMEATINKSPRAFKYTMAPEFTGDPWIEAFKSTWLSDQIAVDRKVMTPEEFREHSRLLVDLHREGKIDAIGFDTETTTLDMHESKAKITTVSGYDYHTKIAFACVYRHPELYTPKVKYDSIMQLKGMIDRLANLDPDSLYDNRDELYNGVRDWTKAHLALELHPHHLVTTVTEDEWIAKIIDLQHLIGSVRKKNMYDKLESILAFIEDLQRGFHYIYVRHHEGYNEEMQRSTDRDVDYLVNNVPVVGHNLKFDVGMLLKFSIGKYIKLAGDSLLSAVLLFGDSIGSLALGVLTPKFTELSSDWKDDMYDDPRIKKNKSGTRYDRVELQKHGLYASSDGISTLLLETSLKKKLAANPMDTTWIHSVILRALKTFSKAEAMGVTIDQDLFHSLDNVYATEKERILDEMMTLPVVISTLETLGVERINPASRGATNQVAAVLFRREALGLRSIEATDAGFPSTGKDVIDTLIEQCSEDLKAIQKWVDESPPDDDVKGYFNRPFIISLNTKSPLREFDIPRLETALRFLKLMKSYTGINYLHNMYIGHIKNYEKDLGVAECYYTAFKVIDGTITGRLSSGFHLLPKKSDIKKMFISSWCDRSTRKLGYAEVGEKFMPEPHPEFYEVEYEDGTIDYLSEEQYRAISGN